MTPEERAEGFFSDPIARHGLAIAFREFIEEERRACADTAAAALREVGTADAHEVSERRITHIVAMILARGGA